MADLHIITQVPTGITQMAAGQRPTRRSVKNTRDLSQGQRDRIARRGKTETQGERIIIFHFRISAKNMTTIALTRARYYCFAFALEFRVNIATIHGNPTFYCCSVVQLFGL